MAVRKDNFLSDLGPRGNEHTKHITLMDGFRFGFGFTVGFLLVTLILSALTWGIFTAIHH